MDVTNCSIEEFIKNENEYLKVLTSDENIWNSIPLLNVNELDRFKNSSLIRFRGMVQDMHGPEYYSDNFEVINAITQESVIQTSKYKDDIDCNENETVNLEGPNSTTKERQTYAVISIPAMNSWAKNIEEEKFKILQNVDNLPIVNGNKRQLDEEMDCTESYEPSKDSTFNSKRPCSNTNKSDQGSSNLMSRECLLNFPIPDPTGKVCLVKIYADTDMLHLNSMFEFVGFLSVDPALATPVSDEYSEMEYQTHHPPPSLIPRLHCISFKKIVHCNPLIDSDLTIDTDRMQFIRKELLIVLTQLLFGDEIAAEYLIYHLISHVYMRKDFMALGKCSLNLSNIPKFEDIDYVQEFYKFLELLVPKSHYLPLSLENMNDSSFIPKKDYECNRLTSSVLQLSANTHLILDETKLSEGKLNEAGVHGVKAISNVIKNQKIMVDFKFYQIEFDCDLPFLIMSEGKSILPNDFHVILQPDTEHLNTFPEITEAAKHFLNPNLLNEIRMYLTLARTVEYEINDEIQEIIQNEFVNMRQNSKMTADDLHSLLVLTRLVSISQGKTIADQDSWRIACKLEESRKARIFK